MQARDVMTTALVTANPDMPVPELARLLLERRISAVPVVDGEGRLLGIVSEGDLIHQLGSERDGRRSWLRDLVASSNLRAQDYLRGHGRVAREVMTADVVAVGETTPLAEIVDLLEWRRIKRVPVLRDGRRVHVFVEHAIGSLQRPMSDAALDAKFAAQSDPVLGAARTAQLIAACRRLGELADVRELTALARPAA